jgi:hypothetical protein
MAISTTVPDLAAAAAAILRRPVAPVDREAEEICFKLAKSFGSCMVEFNPQRGVNRALADAIMAELRKLPTRF